MGTLPVHVGVRSPFVTLLRIYVLGWCDRYHCTYSCLEIACAVNMEKKGASFEEAKVHKIRITLASKDVKSVEKGMFLFHNARY